MTKTDYHARRSTGLCVGAKSCKRKPQGRFCKHHRKPLSPAGKRKRHKVYLAKKLAGLCTIAGCKNPQTEKTLICETHDARRAAYEATEAGREKNSARSRRTRKRRLDAGVCSRCGVNPLETESRCESCAEALRKYRRDVYAAAKGGEIAVQRCRRCRRPGCRINRCDYIEELPPLHIEQFLVGGQHALEMA